jgi:cobalt-zinc-cadmium efflux system protein
MIVTTVILVAELVGGIVTNSLALLSDAAHMFSDVGALALSVLAIWFAGKRASLKRTYGFYRAEVLAALINAVTLVVVSLYIFWEAYQRFRHPQEVQSGLMMVIACIGLVANLISAWVLSRSGSHEHNLNVRGAFLHVLGDALGSLGAIGAGLIMMFTGWYYADPLISVIIGLLVLFSSYRLLRDTVHVLLEGTPPHIDLSKVRRSMQMITGVQDVHDLHVWSVSSGFIAMSGHVVIAEGNDGQSILQELRKVLHDRFGLGHTTIQIETENLHPAAENCTHCD